MACIWSCIHTHATTTRRRPPAIPDERPRLYCLKCTRNWTEPRKRSVWVCCRQMRAHRKKHSFAAVLQIFQNRSTNLAKHRYLFFLLIIILLLCFIIILFCGFYCLLYSVYELYSLLFFTALRSFSADVLFIYSYLLQLTRYTYIMINMRTHHTTRTYQRAHRSFSDYWINYCNQRKRRHHPVWKMCDWYKCWKTHRIMGCWGNSKPHKLYFSNITLYFRVQVWVNKNVLAKLLISLILWLILSFINPLVC